MTVGAETPALLIRMASPEVRFTAPVVEMLNVVAAAPRIVLPKAGPCWGDKAIIWA